MNYIIDCKSGYARSVHIPQYLRFKIFIRMKLLILSLLLFMVHASAVVKSQTVTLHFTDAPLEQVLAEVKKQSGYSFIANATLLKEAKKVTVKVTNADLTEALYTIFKDQPLSAEIGDGIIHIKPRKIKAEEKGTEVKQQEPIRGKVTNNDGQPLIGATIKIKGTNKTVLSNQSGEFTLADVDANATIQVTYVGHTPSELALDGQKTVHITLQPRLGELDNIVVQGYGTTTKRLSTGNIATISANEIAQQPVTNPLQAISGRVSGVQISQISGIPGSGITVQIRGRNSIDASNNPLFIVDGVPFASDNISGDYQLNVISPLNSISPNDIESISILKDADATAIYGSRAANGVVLITTKKGVSGKSKLDVNFNRGYSSITRTPEIMSTAQYLQMRTDAFNNSGTTPTATNAPDLITWDPNLDNEMMDWYMGNTADVYDAGLSFSGGSPNTQFLLSGNFHQENTMFSDKDRYLRGNMHFSLNHTSQDGKLKLKFNGIYGSDNNRVQNTLTGNQLNVARSVPNYPYFDDLGNYNWTANQTNYKATATAYTKANIDNLNLNLSADYQITKDLLFIVNLGYGRLANDTMRPTPSTSRDPASSSPLGTNSFRTANAKTYLFEPQLNFNRQIFKGNLSFLLGSTVQKRNSSTDQVSYTNYINDLLIESRNGATNNNNNSTHSEYNFLSAFARANYIWEDRYIVNATFRRDGSSRFGAGQRFGNFGSIGAAWLFSNESFLKDKTNWFSYGKLRGSYGTTGSDGIGDYGYLSLYTSGTAYGTQVTINPSQIANENYQWEETKKLEGALDLGFFQDRVLLSATRYRNRSGNQLVTFPLPVTTGFSGYIANLPALVQNSGWEFELNTENLKKTFTWNTSFNLTIPKNELVEFPNIEQTSYANTLVIGKPLNLFLGFQFAGIDADTGIPSVVDVSGNGVISGNSSYNERGGDKIYVGTTDPQWFAGINNNFSWKGLSVDIFFQYTKQDGYNLFSNGNGFNSFGTMQNGFTAWLDYWKEPGDNSQTPKPFASNNTALAQFAQSERTFEDASFLRLKTLAFSYILPNKWTKRTGLTNTQLFARGQNLWTITNYDAQDPEQAMYNGITKPLLRTFQFGIKTSL